MVLGTVTKYLDPCNKFGPGGPNKIVGPPLKLLYLDPKTLVEVTSDYNISGSYFSKCSDV